MTTGDIAFAQACVRGFHTALAAFKQWAARQKLTRADENFLRALEITGDAAKEWVKEKADELVSPAEKEKASNAQQ